MMAFLSRGLRRKLRQVAVYWKFRLLVRAARGRIAPGKASSGTPEFSLIVAAYRTRPAWLRRAVASVRRQSFGNWELCLGLCEVSPALRLEMESLARLDPRIRIVDLGENRGISGNNNRLAAEARGDYLAVLDHDDYLEPNALAEMAAKAASGNFDLIFSDEDVVIGPLCLPAPPNLKPTAFAPESCSSANYICHFCCFRRSLFEKVGGFRPDFDGAQDYDLFLRITEMAQGRVAHVPKVLYHWRRHGGSTSAGAVAGAKPYAWEAGRRAMQAHLDRVEPGATAEFGTVFGTLRTRHDHAEKPRVEIIIPSADRDGTLGRCLRSILKHTRYPDYRVTVMLNGPDDFDALRARHANEPRIRFLYFAEPFNFSRINNVGAAACDGEMLLFLNDDIEVEGEGWIEGLLEHALRPGIGAVGPRLSYPDGSIQHAGICVDPEVVTWEIDKGLAGDAAGYHAHAGTVQNVTAVTGACLMTRRECFREVGGFDENFPLAYNDIDYCLKLLAAGRRIVYTPFVRLMHHESLTRGADQDIARRARLSNETKRMRDKWGAEGLTDRYFDVRLFRPGADLGRMAREYWTRTKA
jgi:GT2 family glycosyltransferase